MATHFVYGPNSLRQLAEALGFKDKPVTRILIDCKVNAAIQATVEFFMEVPGHEGLCTIVKEYELHLKPTMTNEVNVKSWRDDPLL